MKAGRRGASPYTRPPLELSVPIGEGQPPLGGPPLGARLHNSPSLPSPVVPLTMWMACGTWNQGSSCSAPSSTAVSCTRTYAGMPAWDERKKRGGVLVVVRDGPGPTRVAGRGLPAWARIKKPREPPGGVRTRVVQPGSFKTGSDRGAISCFYRGGGTCSRTPSRPPTARPPGAGAVHRFGLPPTRLRPFPPLPPTFERRPPPPLRLPAPTCQKEVAVLRGLDGGQKSPWLVQCVGRHAPCSVGESPTECSVG